jgi:polyisoprenoid-binding protein YceI
MTTQNSSLTRSVDGRNIPAAGRYIADLSHSSVELIVRHLMVSKVRARIAQWTAEFTIGEDPTESTLNATLDMGSFTSGDESRDGHVKSADFFDVENFPTATFTSTSVTPQGDAWAVAGDLTLKGVTSPLTLVVSFLDTIEDPFGNIKTIFSAEAELDRDAYGISFNAPLATGGLLIGKAVKLELEVQAVPA